MLDLKQTKTERKQRIHPDTILISGVRHVNAKKLAEILGIGEHYIRRIAREGKIPYHKIGSKSWFNPEKVVKETKHEPVRQLPITGIDYEGLQGF